MDKPAARSSGPAPGLSPAALAARLAAAGRGGRLRGDHDLNPGMGRPARRLPAAVLVALLARPGGPTVLLTRRADGLADHGGEISLPGGRIEPTDRDPAAAALREAAEEVGLPAGRVRLLGRLDDYLTRTGFLVRPVVGLVARPPRLRPDPLEVAEIFELPLAHLLDPANRRIETRPAGGQPRRFHVIPYRGRDIWGATAGMLVNLCEVLGRGERRGAGCVSS